MKHKYKQELGKVEKAGIYICSVWNALRHANAQRTGLRLIST